MKSNLPLWREPLAPRAAVSVSFLPLLRRAVEANPQSLYLVLDLARAYGKAGQWHDAVALLEAEMHVRGPLPELAVELGVAARQQDDLVKSLSAMELAVTESRRIDEASSEPGRSALAQRIRIEMASLFLALGRCEEAAAYARDALDHKPHEPTALSIASDALLRAGDAASLIALLEMLEGHGVQSTTLLACRANALAASGAFDALEELLSPDRWCKQVMIGEPDMRARMAESILSHPAMDVSSQALASRGSNRRLESLANRSEPVIQSALSMIRREVEIYIEERMHFAHPVTLQCPHEVILQGWALETSDDGHETRHIHVRSWLTAVYYVRVPERLDGAASPPRGSIVFGPWPAPVHQSAYVFPSWHIEPREGMLLIFPSFLAHQTVPSETGEPRLCLSLDVMACPPRKRAA